MKLTILGTSDLHGQLLGCDDPKDEAADSGGMARLCAYIQQVRAENPNTLLLDAGDVIQGSILTDALCSRTPDEPNPLLTAMNFLGYDAMTLGNHEFDCGIPNLKKILSQVQFPVLAANVRDAEGRFLTGNGWKIFNCGGVRVAVIGVVTPDIPIWNGRTEGVSDYRYLPAADAVREAIAKIGTDADLFVVSAHMGLYPEFDEENGSDSAQKILDENPEIAVLQVAHNHVVVREKQGDTLIGGVRNNGLDVARFDLTLDSRHRVVDSRVEIVAMSGILPDEEFRNLPFVREACERTRQLTAAQRSAGRKTGEKIGIAAAEFVPGKAVRGLPQALFRNDPVMELIHRAQLEASGADVSVTPLYCPDAGLPAGELHESDVREIYPFENLLYCVPVTGAELKAVMEWAAAAYQTDGSGAATRCLPPQVPYFRFDTFSGVDYEIDLSQPAGRRIRNVRFAGEPLQDDRMLTLAVNNFRYASVLKGEKLVSGKKVWQSACTIPELLKEYIREHSPLMPEVCDNWKITGAALDGQGPGKTELEETIMSLSINKTKNAVQTTVALSGRLDTTTAPELEAQLRELLPETNALVLDFEALDYISSAGLRVLLVAQKEMNKKNGQMTLTHVNETVMEVLEVTGFTDILTIA